MNYRHAFHAGNHADCVKHALLHALVTALLRKPAPFRVLDTHAGVGTYALNATEARRTAEWRDGIGRLGRVTDGPLRPWLSLVRTFPAATYPGSPALVRAMLRPGDHLTLCELHPVDAATLRAAHRRDPQVSVHHRDGHEAAPALTPFPERRGLILLDPPYEAPDEFDRVANTMARVHRRFPAGIQAAWYPIKGRAPARAFRDGFAAAGIPDVIALELHLRAPTDPARLNGSGLLVVNPPWGFEDAARDLLGALLAHLSDGEPGAGIEVARVTPE